MNDLPTDNNCKYISPEIIGNGGLFVITESNNTFCLNSSASITFSGTDPAITVDTGINCITIDLNGHCLDGVNSAVNNLGIELLGNSHTITIKNGTLRNMEIGICNFGAPLNTLSIENIVFENVVNPILLDPMAPATHTNVTIKNCKIFTPANVPASNVVLNSVNHLIIKDCKFSNATINIDSASAISVSNVVLSTTTDITANMGSLFVFDSNKVFVENVIVHENQGGNGITFLNVENSKIISSKITNSADRGLLLCNSFNATIQHVSIQSSFFHGIYIEDCSQCVVEKCTVQNNGDHGIFITGDGADYCLKGCKSINNTFDGYSISGGELIIGVLENCVALSNFTSGFFLDVDTTEWKVIGCCSKLNADGFLNFAGPLDNVFVNLLATLNGFNYCGITTQPIVTADMGGIANQNTNYWTNLEYP